MSATSTTEAPSQRNLLTGVVAEIHESGKTTREIAEAALAAASDEANREAAIQGWQDVVRRYEADWSSQSKEPRSGHNNSSGRYAQQSSGPDLGVLGEPVHTNDGHVYRVAEVTIEIAETLRAEYRQREQSSANGRKFWSEIAKAMRAIDAKTAADLGQEHVEEIRQRTGYRVR